MINSMAKHQDLQPWLAYFDMLKTYEQKGFLHINTEKREAYITQPALFTLANCSFSDHELGDAVQQAYNLRAIGAVVRRLRAYASFKASEHLFPSFAVNVVKDTEPHDPINTILLTSRRKWYRFWQIHDHFEIINY